MAREKFPFTICGRVVGKATGWDHSDTFALMLYEFEPAPGYLGPVGECVNFDFTRGVIEVLEDDGTVSGTTDLIAVLNNIPKKDSK
jgi:hypothetical protein